MNRFCFIWLRLIFDWLGSIEYHKYYILDANLYIFNNNWNYLSYIYQFFFQDFPLSIKKTDFFSLRVFCCCCCWVDVVHLLWPLNSLVEWSLAIYAFISCFLAALLDCVAKVDDFIGCLQRQQVENKQGIDGMSSVCVCVFFLFLSKPNVGTARRFDSIYCYRPRPMVWNDDGAVRMVASLAQQFVQLVCRQRHRIHSPHVHHWNDPFSFAGAIANIWIN